MKEPETGLKSTAELENKFLHFGRMLWQYFLLLVFVTEYVLHIIVTLPIQTLLLIFQGL